MVCGSCTLCCKLLAVPWMDSPAGEPCRECEPGVGCKLWPNAPRKCRAFECAWRQVKASPDLRPDRCRVMFEKIGGEVFLGTTAPGFTMTPAVIGQVRAFNEQGFSVVIAAENPRQRFVWPAKGCTMADVRSILAKAASEVSIDNLWT